MNKIVIIDHGEPITNSIAIAEGTSNSHHAVQQLIRKHKSALESGGVLAFEMRKPLGIKGGRPVEVFLLNEEQSTLLIAFMKNTEVVVRFKIQLVKEFYRMKTNLSQIMVRHQNDEWKQLRETGKQTRREQTDIIKSFVDYAVAQGSTHAKRYYSNITKMQNESIFFLEQKFDNLRDLLSGQQLQVIAAADMIVEKALEEGMIKGMHYKEIFKMAKERVELFASVIPRTTVPMSINEARIASIR